MHPTHKFAALDGLRGLAAIIVVLYHAAKWFDGFRLQGSYLAVDFFFILSGFVIAYAYDERLRSGMSFTAFMLARLIRLYPFYLLGLVVVVALMSYRGAHLRPTAIGFGLVLLPDLRSAKGLWLIFVCWSLFFELIANALFALLYPVLTLRVLICVCGAALALLIYSAWSFGSLDVGWKVHNALGGLARGLFGFFVGVLLYRIRTPLPWARSLAWPLCLLLLGGFAIRLAPPIRTFADLGLVVLLFPLVVTVAASAEPRRLSASIFLAIGAMSYGLYILHPVAIGLVNMALGKGHVSMTQGVFALLTLGALVWLLDAVYDQPIRRRLNASLARRRERQPAMVAAKFS